MSRFFSYITSIFASKLAKKEQISSKKPQNRPLRAEPLEERLPVSSSAAGVLLGLGIANETSSTEVVSQQQTPNETTVQLDTSVNVTLNPLDATLVDQVHSEESLNDTISSTSSSVDSFVLTPLSADSILDDAESDPVRELGNELLLFQISTLDFSMTQFNPIFVQRDTDSPERVFSPGFTDIAISENPEETTLVFAIQNSDYVPHVFDAALMEGSMTGSNSVNYRADEGWSHADHTLYVLGNDTALVCVFHSGEEGDNTCDTGVRILGDDGDVTYWSINSPGFRWTRPAGISVQDAKRDFTFQVYAVGGDTIDFYVHIGWTKVDVAFAGGGFDHAGGVKNDAGKTDQTQDNTVVVGQHVQARVNVDPVFSVVANSYNWTTPGNNAVVKDYDTTNQSGVITYLTPADKTASTVEYFYYLKPAGTGSVTCALKVTDPHGTQRNVSAGASFYIETAVCDVFTSTFATYANGASTVGVRPWKTGVKELILGGTETYQVNGVNTTKFEPGIEWQAIVTAPVYGAGKVAFTQLLDRTLQRRQGTSLSTSSTPGWVLDTNFPYSAAVNIRAEERLDTPPAKGEDSPGIQLNNAYDWYNYDHFDATLYCIYKPNGIGSIWVSLAVMTWGFTGAATKNIVNGQPEWSKTGNGTPSGGNNWHPTTILPTWSDNFKNYSFTD